MKYFILYLSIAILGVACSKMDDPYKELIKPGGRVYVEKANAKALPGYKKIEIVWPRAADPNVTRARIYWNNNADSLDVTINPQADTVRQTISNLNEQIYTFLIKTFDKDGNSSVPVEIVGRSYGDTYLGSLANRSLVAAEIRSGIMNLDFGAPTTFNGEVALEVLYNDVNNQPKIRMLNNEQTELSIIDYHPSTKFSYRTAFLPDSNAVDTIFTDYSIVNKIKLDKSLWRVVSFSDQHDEPGGGAAGVIDGTAGTRWHTRVIGGVAPYPHWLIVDMGSERTFTEFSVERTTKDAPTGDLRGPDTFEVLISKDNTTWTSLGIFNFNRFLGGEQKYPIASTASGRYFKFVALTGPGNVMALGEISAYGY